MKRFMAVYIGTEAALEKKKWNELSEEKRKQLEKEGFDAWMKWGVTHAADIVEQGAPLGKTKRVGPAGISDTTNSMTGYVVVQAESHDAAAKLFTGHPHFSIFPGDSVEIVECIPLPDR